MNDTGGCLLPYRVSVWNSLCLSLYLYFHLVVLFLRDDPPFQQSPIEVQKPDLTCGLFFG